MSIAKLSLISHMQELGWPDNLTFALANFFLNLENHPKRQEPDGDTILLAYQAQVRREWHRALKNKTGGAAFDISVINDDLIEKIGNKIWTMQRHELTTR